MIRTSVRDAVTLLTLDRPERRNALDTQHCRSLLDAASILLAAFRERRAPRFRGDAR